MYNFLLFFAIALIGIVLFLAITKKKPWKIILVILLITIGGLLLFGFRFTASSALPARPNVIERVDTSYGKAILYEDRNNHTFGIAKVERNLGFLYHYSGGASDYFIEGNEPFQAAGYGSNEEKDGFIVGVRTSDPTIKYIVVGNHLENIMSSDTYKFTIKTVEEYPESYHMKEVKASHAFFVFDEYSEATWTIRALDKDGHLVAEKLFGTGEARYIAR